ncbi:MAG: tetratricopeptide repeat protein, partial [Chlorobi bacterium]|nr:tetratricopeptide repeat protein [Chlorobiota bacterium]
MRKFFAILLMYNMFFVTGSGGQNIDSLKTKPGNLTSSERGRILFDKGNAYLKSGELDSCVFYTRKAVKFLEYDSDLSNAYENLGMCFYYKNDFAEALENFKISAAYAEDAGNDSIIARRYSDLGVVYDYLGAYDKATENYLKAVKIFEKNKDYYGISKISNNLGVINETLGKYDMALSYYNKSLELKQKVGANPEESASTYVNIGSVSEKRGDTEGALSQYKKALDIYEKSGNVRYAALCLNNTANIYYEKNKLESAEKYVRKALNLSGKFPESGIRGKSYLILSNIFISRSDYDKALQYLKKASEIAEKRELTELKKDISESEIKISESAGD